jgi:hypothetical protein
MKNIEATNATSFFLKIFFPIRKRVNTLKELKIIETSFPEVRDTPKILKKIYNVKS